MHVSSQRFSYLKTVLALHFYVQLMTHFLSEKKPKHISAEISQPTKFLSSSNSERFADRLQVEQQKALTVTRCSFQPIQIWIPRPFKLS